MALLQSPMSATLLGIALIALLAPFVLKGLEPVQGERGLARRSAKFWRRQEIANRIQEDIGRL